MLSKQERQAMFDECRDKYEAQQIEMAHPNLLKGLERHIVYKFKVGHFLTAFLANDLEEAISRADDVSITLFRELKIIVYNFMPHESHGSYLAVKLWIAEGDKEREEERQLQTKP